MSTAAQRNGADPFTGRLTEILKTMQVKSEPQKAPAPPASPVAEPPAQDAFAERLTAALGGGPAANSGSPEAPSAPARSGGPVGEGAHVVVQGECTASIAKRAGHCWETIWNDAQNSRLRESRKDPYVLLPGDRVHVPPLRQKWQPGQAEARHRFRRRGWPEVFRVRVLRDDEPRGNEPYELDIDGAQHSGTTDADGNLAVAIAPDARHARLQIGAASDRDHYEFTLGAIDPIDECSGVQGRLHNLGFDPGPIDGKWGPQTEAAVRLYQSRRDLPVSGEADEATRRKLQEEYGC